MSLIIVLLVWRCMLEIKFQFHQVLSWQSIIITVLILRSIQSVETQNIWYHRNVIHNVVICTVQNNALLFYNGLSLQMNIWRVKSKYMICPTRQNLVGEIQRMKYHSKWIWREKNKYMICPTRQSLVGKIQSMIYHSRGISGGCKVNICMIFPTRTSLVGIIQSMICHSRQISGWWKVNMICPTRTSPVGKIQSMICKRNIWRV